MTTSSTRGSKPAARTRAARASASARSDSAAGGVSGSGEVGPPRDGELDRPDLGRVDGAADDGGQRDARLQRRGGPLLGQAGGAERQTSGGRLGRLAAAGAVGAEDSDAGDTSTTAATSTLPRFRLLTTAMPTSYLASARASRSHWSVWRRRAAGPAGSRCWIEWTPPCSASPGLSTIWLAYLLVRESVRPGWPLLLLVVFWILVTYLLLPRLHRILTRIYVPGYFIGRTRTSDGLLGDPINLGWRGHEAQIHLAMTRGGWTRADDLNADQRSGDRPLDAAAAQLCPCSGQPAAALRPPAGLRLPAGGGGQSVEPPPRPVLAGPRRLAVARRLCRRLARRRHVRPQRRPVHVHVADHPQDRRRTPTWSATTSSAPCWPTAT